MDNSIVKTAVDLCAEHGVDNVLVTSDGQYFLPRAIQHAKNHANKLQTKLTIIDKEGGVMKFLEQAIEASTETKITDNVVALADFTVGQLKNKCADMGIEVTAKARKQDLIDAIEAFVPIAEAPAQKADALIDDADVAAAAQVGLNDNAE